jgi:alpha-beta hydrolase superfamily lysophospholipase
VIYAADHKGHGRSEGVRAYIESFDVFVEDQRIFYDLIREKERNIPIFLLGSSMGSFIATILTATYLKDIDGLVLSSTGTKLGGFNLFTKIIARFLALLVPKKKIEELSLRTLMIGWIVISLLLEFELGLGNAWIFILRAQTSILLN